MTVKTATGVTPFRLVYSHEAVLPAKIMIPSFRAERQKELISREYEIFMYENFDKIDEVRLLVLDYLQAYQSQVSSTYNKKIKAKLFTVGDLVLKFVLPIDRNV